MRSRRHAKVPVEWPKFVEVVGYPLMTWIMEGRQDPMAPVELSRNQQESINTAFWPDGHRYVVIGPRHLPMQGPRIETVVR